MSLVLSAILFPVALAGLIYSAKWFLNGATQVGLAIGASPFVIGGFCYCTWLHLYLSLWVSIVSVVNGLEELPVAQVVGSNVFNILLILGLTAVIARKITIHKNLIDVELPLPCRYHYLLCYFVKRWSDCFA